MPTPRRYVDRRGHETWRVRLRDRGRESSETFTTKAQALAFARLVGSVGGEAARDHLYADLAVPTLDAWAERWLGSLPGVTRGTVVGYRSAYRRVWAPALGSMRIDLIRREDVARALAGLPTCSDKTLRNWWGVLASMLKRAAADGLIPRSPAVGIRLPRHDTDRVEKRFLTHAEFRAIYDAAAPSLRPLLLFLAGTGCRYGEAVALDIADADLARATVRITKAQKWGRQEIGPTKTRRSRRTVVLPPQLVIELAPLVAGRARTEPLFLSPRGERVRHSVVYRGWRAACLSAGVDPPPRLHDLRHTHVAWLVAAGVPLTVVQARLGHESITTTWDVYGHLMPDAQRAAMDAAAAALPAIERPG